MSDSGHPKFRNDRGVPEICIGVREFECIGVSPPQDHPHIYIDMGAADTILCPYCGTRFRFDPRLTPLDAEPPDNLFLGDVIAEPSDIYGDGVNIAVRLEGLAEPGGICISRVVRDQIRDKLLYPFTDMGEQSVKNIAKPVRCYAMNAAGLSSFNAKRIGSARPTSRCTRFAGRPSASRREPFAYPARSLLTPCWREPDSKSWSLSRMTDIILWRRIDLPGHEVGRLQRHDDRWGYLQRSRVHHSVAIIAW